MSKTSRQRPKKLSINPIELAIFSIIAVVFLNSVYKLLFDWKGVENIPIAKKEQRSEEDRKPASLSYRSFTNLEIDCDVSAVETTTKSKIRLTGPLCGLSSEAQGRKPVSTEILNTANQVKATVFTFDESRRFSTDYIPLNLGENPIQMKFIYSGGKTVSQTITINKEKAQRSPSSGNTNL